MTTRNATALCQATDLPPGQDGQAPEWVHVMPSGIVTTVDGRGPYVVKDALQLTRDSLQAAGGRMPIDENHSTDLAGPKGLPAPARGWLVELQARSDGIWGRVEWTDEGRQLVASKAYRSISPVIRHLKDGSITAILRASLVNQPNLRGLTALHSTELDMELLAKLRKILGLADDADDAAIMAAIDKLKTPDKPALQTALQAQLAPIATALGLKDDADSAAVLQSIATIKTGPNDAVTALQAELRTVTTNFNTLQSSIATQNATTFVDNAIKAGRVGVKPLRDHYIAMHAADPRRVEKEINAMPIMPDRVVTGAVMDTGSEVDAIALAAAATTHQKTLADAGQIVDYATAVLAVSNKENA